MLLTSIPFLQATALIAGLAVAGAALAGRYSIQAWHAYKARPIVPRMRKFYEGGFQATMTRREAGLILGIRCVLYKSIISMPESSILYVSLGMQIFTSRILAASHPVETVLCRVHLQHTTWGIMIGVG
jgi:hypothetical protein